MKRFCTDCRKLVRGALNCSEWSDKKRKWSKRRCDKCYSKIFQQQIELMTTRNEETTLNQKAQIVAEAITLLMINGYSIKQKCTPANSARKK